MKRKYASKANFTTEICNSMNRFLNSRNYLILLSLIVMLSLMNITFGKVLVEDENVYNCFGIVYDDDNVCNGKGSCTSQNVCNCSLGYFGKDCSLFTCNNILYNHSSVCSGRGICQSPDNCTCFNSTLFGGSDCEQVYCFGIIQSSENVCSNRSGNCIDTDRCKCFSGYYGEICQYRENYSCFGIENSNASVCSGRGVCSSKDTCTCSDRFIGPSCEIFSCSGVPSTDTNVCYGNGQCIGPNICECSSTFEGRFCQFEIPPVKYKNKNYIFQTIAGYNPYEEGLDGKLTYLPHTNFFISNETLYLAGGTSHVVRKMDFATRKVYTIAGQLNTPGYIDGNSSSALFNNVNSLFVTESGIIYVVDMFNYLIRKIDETGNVSTIAGIAGLKGAGEDGILATKSSLNDPTTVRLNQKGEIFYSESYRIRKIGLDGIVNTVAGSDTNGYSGDGGRATACRLNNPNSFFLNTDGSILIADTNNLRIRKVGTNGKISTIAGSGEPIFYYFTEPSSVGIYYPYDVFQNSDGVIFITDRNHNLVRKINSGLSVITTIAGTRNKGTGEDGILATDSDLNYPTSIFQYKGEIYFGDSGNSKIRKIDSLGYLRTVAGHGVVGFNSDTCEDATKCQVYKPDNIIFKGEDLIFADTFNGKIRKISRDNNLTTIVGTNNDNFKSCGNGTLPLECNVVFTSALSLLKNGDIVFSASLNTVLLKYNLESNLILRVAGQWNTVGGEDKGLLGSGVHYSTISENDEIFFSDYTNHLIAKISLLGNIEIVAGTIRVFGSSGDGRYAINCKLNYPSGLFFSDSGDLYLADSGNHKIRRIRNGIIETIVGNGTAGYSSEGTSINSTLLNNPKHVMIVGDELLILEMGNDRIIKFNLSNNSRLSIVLGASKNGTIIHSTLNHPSHMAYKNGQLVIVETDNNQISGLMPICYGLEARNQLVCSGQGSCTSPNNCTCDKNYFGESCNQHYCYNVLNSDENVCNGNGRCLSFNNCECKLGWIGRFCNISVPIHQCFGLYNFDPAVCSYGNGTCVSHNFCNCTPSRVGNQCQISVCNGVLANSSRVCSSKGVCNLKSQCICNSGYAGNDCQYPICYSIPSNLPSVCHGHGSCVSPSKCVCNDGFLGAGCQIVKCWKLTTEDIAVCSSRGNCISNNTCSCFDGYFGNECQITSCSGIPSNNSYVCSGKGSCIDYNQCLCDNLYYGDKCQYLDSRYRMQYSLNTVGGYDSVSSPLDSRYLFVNPSGLFANNDFLYISTKTTVRRVDLKTNITSIIAGFTNTAGNANDPFNNVSAISSKIDSPEGIWVNGDNMYFVDSLFSYVLKVDLNSGIMSTIAGTGVMGYSTDPIATKAKLSNPRSVVVAPNGYIFISDSSNNRIRVVVNGIISTLCQAQNPYGMFLTDSGDLLFAEQEIHQIKKITRVTDQVGGIVNITRVAGIGYADYKGDGKLALEAYLNSPSSVVMDRYGNIYIADTKNHVIRMISNTTMIITTIAGSTGGFDDDLPKLAKFALFTSPKHLAINSQDELFVADGNFRVRKIILSNGMIYKVVGYGPRNSYDNIDPTNLDIIGSSSYLQYFKEEFFYIDTVAGDIRKLNSEKRSIIIAKGFQNPSALFISPKGEKFFFDSTNIIKKIDLTGAITNVIGNGEYKMAIEGELALKSPIKGPLAINMLSTGEIIFTELYRILKLGKDGKIHLLAGSTDISLLFKDNINATKSRIWISHPSLVVSPTDDIYFLCATSGFRVRKISNMGIISTVVGNGGYVTYGADNVLASQYPISILNGLTMTLSGELIVWEGSKIRKVTKNGYIYTIAGTGIVENTQNTKRATTTSLSSISSIVAAGEKVYCSATNGNVDGRIYELVSFLPICYSKLANESTVCSSRGECIDENTCSCDSPYYGKQCTEFDCFGVWRNDSQVCYGRGNCTFIDTCQCNNGYLGKTCEISSCYGVSSNSSLVCSGHGSCISKNQCLCNGNYTGNNCEYPLCYGVFSNNATSCSGNGNCTHPNRCMCKNGWVGRNCEIPICFNKTSTDIGVCSGHGDCVGANQCLCYEGYFGDECRIVKCFGKLSNQTGICSGNGNCIHPDICRCSIQYGGEDCQYPKCYGIVGDGQGIACSSRGQCVSPDTCECYANYYGRLCNVSSCFGKLNNESSTCSGNGKCIDTDLCDCDMGYGGRNCHLFVCGGILSNESTTCSGNGKCIHPRQCSCYDGYVGYLCQHPTCYGTIFNDTQVCSGRGQCLSSNNCSCQQITNSTKIYGLNCEKVQCLGEGGKFFSQTSPKVCSGRGLCSAFGCECSRGYTGDYCQNHTCNGTIFADANVCSGKGSCVDADQCTCKGNDLDGYWSGQFCEKCLPSYSGLNCAKKICNENTTCSGNGKCNSSLDCECTGNWAGRFCNTCQNNRYGTNCEIFCQPELTCSSHGICDTNGSCQCYSDSTNGYWSSSNCKSCMPNYYGEKCATRIVGDVKFTDLGNGLTFKLFGPLSYEGMNVECSSLLRSEEQSLFGENPACMWTNKSDGTFFIQFGDRFNLFPGMNISLNRLVFDFKGVQDYEVFSIIGAQNPVKPVSIISNMKNIIGLCDTVEIDGSRSYSGDRKALIFNWKFLQIPDVKLMDYLNSTDFTKSTSISIPSNSSEGEYSIGLMVTSTLSGAQSNVSIFSFTKSGIPLPTVTIVGKSIVNLKTTDIPYVIRPELSLPNCFYSDRNISVTWNQLSGPSISTEKDLFGNLILSNLTSRYKAVYQFEVQAVSVHNYLSRSSAQVYVSITNSDLELISYLSEIDDKHAILNVELNDPDYIDEKETWLWTCQELETLGDCDEYIDNQLVFYSNEKSTLINLTPSETRNLLLKLSVTKGERIQSSEISVAFPKDSSSIPPLISLISANPNRAFLVREEFLSLQLSVSIGGVGDGIDIQREWLINSKPLPSSLLQNSNIEPNTTNSLVLDTSTLEEGNSYTLTLNVISTQSQLSSSYSYSFKIARSPQSCECSVSPSTGYILDTLFKFECLNCQNQEKTIDFVYGYVDDVLNAKIPLYSLGESYPNRLPPPSNILQSSLKTFITIVDTATGASCTKNYPVTMLYPDITSEMEYIEKIMEWNRVLIDEAASSNPNTIALYSLAIQKTSEALWNRLSQISDRKRGVNAASAKVNIRRMIVDNYAKALNQRNKAELMTEQYLTNQIVGILPILEANDEMEYSLFLSISKLIKDIHTASLQNKNLKMTSLENNLKLMFKSMDRYIVSNSTSSQETKSMVSSLISDYSLLIVRNKDVGYLPFELETNTTSVQASKNYINQLSSRVFVTREATVKTPPLMSRFVNSYSNRKPLTYMLKISNSSDVNFSLGPMSKRKRRRMSKYLLEYSIREYKLKSMSESIRYEIPLLETPPSNLTSSSSERQVTTRTIGGKLRTTIRREYMSCVTTDSTDMQFNDDSDCIYDYDESSQVGICKCSKQTQVAIVLTTDESEVLPNTNVEQKGNYLEYLAFLSFIPVIAIIVVVIIVIGIIISCRVIGKRRQPPAPKELTNLEMI